MSNHVIASIGEGVAAARRRPALTLLVYAVNLSGALLLSSLLYRLLVDTIGVSGFGDQKLLDFDTLIWQEAMATGGGRLVGIVRHLLWIVPLYLLWRVVEGVGLIYAHHQGGAWSFWRGVGHYMMRGLALAMIWLPVRVLAIGSVFVGATGLASLWEGEIGTFWSMLVILPAALITVLAMIDLFERYGRLAMIVRHERILSAFATGIGWPFRHGSASFLYLFWFFVALAVLIVPTLIGARGATTLAGIWVAFFIQQLVMLVRAAITVAWTGSEVALFEHVWMSHPSPVAPHDVRPAIA
ncbi:MAG: hypothetical protein R2834_05855 [Rhodothermales bacterium]